MRKKSTRVPTARWLSLLALICLSSAPYLATPQPGRAPHATRQQLIGAWQLVSIQILGPNGAMPDPFYGADPSGFLVYDASGWMSVQIVGQHRPAMDAAASRPTPTDPAETARLKAAVLDSYYAYYGTWEFDEATSMVTHHLKSSLIPGESGKSYSQTVSLEGGELIFTTRRDQAGGPTVQKKVWKRVSGPQG
jgi:Lipocalin-like domain